MADTACEQSEEEADAEALKQLRAGLGVPHAEVAAWLQTWGTPDEKPMPKEWLSRAYPTRAG